MNDPYQKDIGEFGMFLRTINSIDEFFERKKPAFRDWYIREMTMACIEQGYGDHDGMLLALKQSEKQRYVRLRDGTATVEDRWPLARV